MPIQDKFYATSGRDECNKFGLWIDFKITILTIYAYLLLQNNDIDDDDSSDDNDNYDELFPKHICLEKGLRTCLLVLFVLGDGSEEVGEVCLTFAVGNRPLRAGCHYD